MLNEYISYCNKCFQVVVDAFILACHGWARYHAQQHRSFKNSLQWRTVLIWNGFWDIRIQRKFRFTRSIWFKPIQACKCTSRTDESSFGRNKLSSFREIWRNARQWIRNHSKSQPSSSNDAVKKHELLRSFRRIWVRLGGLGQACEIHQKSPKISETVL